MTPTIGIGRGLWRVSVAFLLAAASIAVGADASGAVEVDGWRTPVKLTHGERGGWDVAMGGHGRAVAVWYGDRSLMSALRVPGEGWSVPRAIARLRPQAYLNTPAVAMNGRGAIVVAYQDQRRMMAVRRPAGGGWQPPTRLRRSPLKFAKQDVSLGPDGTATVLLGLGPDGHADIVAVRSRPDGLGWFRGRRLGRGDTPRIVTGPAGRVTAAWWCPQHLCVSTHRRGHAWTKAARVHRSCCSSLDLAIDGVGRVHLVTGDFLLTRSPGGRWRSRPAPPGRWYDAEVSAAGRGRAVAVFGGPARGTRTRVAAMTRRPDGTWAVSRVMPATSLSVSSSVDRRGHAAVLVAPSYRAGDVLVARFSPASGWTPWATVAHGAEARLLSSPGGRSVLFYSRRQLWASVRPDL